LFIGQGTNGKWVGMGNHGKNNRITICIVIISLIFLLSYFLGTSLVQGQSGIYYVYLPLILSGQSGPIEPTPTSTLELTPTSTLEPTPTSTLEPTPTSTQPPPTSTPTQEPEEVTILPNHTSYVDSIDYLHVVGEVYNNTSHDLRFVRIHVNVYNSNGNLLDTGFTYTQLDNVPAGDKACFNFSIQAPAGWDYYEFEPVSYRTDGDPLPNLTTSNLSSSYDATF
jgi:hypothetical protein